MSSILSKLNSAEQQRNKHLEHHATQYEGLEISAEEYSEYPPKKSTIKPIVFGVLIVVLILIGYRQGLYPQLTTESADPVVKAPLVEPIKQPQTTVEAAPIDNVDVQPWNLEGLLYVANEPELSKVVINGKLLKTGQSIQPNVVVEDISGNWVRLNVDGKSITIDLP